MSYCFLVHTNNLNLTYSIVLQLQLSILDHQKRPSKWKIQILVLIIVIALWPTMAGVQLHGAKQHLWACNNSRHIRKNRILSHTSYSQDFLKPNELTNLSDLNACTSKIILAFSLFVLNKNTRLHYFWIFVQYTFQWTILREKDCFVPLSCGQDSKSATTNITPALSPLCFSPASKHTSQNCILFYLLVLAYVYLDTVVQISENTSG